MVGEGKAVARWSCLLRKLDIPGELKSLLPAAASTTSVLLLRFFTFSGAQKADQQLRNCFADGLMGGSLVSCRSVVQSAMQSS